MKTKASFLCIVAVSLLFSGVAKAESNSKLPPTIQHHRKHRHHRRHPHPILNPTAKANSDSDPVTLAPVIVTAQHPLHDNELADINVNLATELHKMPNAHSTAEMADFDPNLETNRITSTGSLDYHPHEQSSCRTVDMRAQFGDLRDQDGMGWCFAETAADLLSQKLGKRVSMMDISMLYFQQKNVPQKDAATRFINQWVGGSTGYAVAAIVHRGNICTEEEFPDDYFQALMAKPLAKGEDISQRLCHKELIDNEHFDHVEAATKNGLQDPNIACTAVKDLKEMFPATDIANIVHALKDGDDAVSVINWLRNLGCKNPVAVPKDLKIVDESANWGSGQVLMASIDANLDHENAVGIGYNEAPLALGSSYKAGTSLHASSIIGRKFMDGKCQYLVRNSHGRNCIGARPCEGGNFWITEDDIKNYVYSIQYFK